MRSLVPLSAFVGLAFAFTAVDAALASKSICSATSSTAVANARLLAIGNYHGPRASDNNDAQRYFNQGLVFGWGFNFAEAVRSFRAAVQRDPGCSLCRWGIAWALGPSINHDMQPADVPVAIDAIVQARAYANAGSRERALIDALATRYSMQHANADQLARSYANAMRALANRFEDDADIAVLAAESMMNAHAYDYWSSDGRPRTWTPEIIRLLERALRIDPDHPGAHHYRIHLFEESAQPERALPSAAKLGTLAPVVGHLVHMPAHIYFRLGRYRDAMLANQAAVHADREYAAATGADSGYAIHNLHFLWASALWNGDSAIALSAARQLAAAATKSDDQGAGLRQHLLAAPVLTHVRFGEWSELVSAGIVADASTQPHLVGLTHFATGIAHAARGEISAARSELESLRRAQRLMKTQALTIKNINQAADVLNVARLLLQSAIARAQSSNNDAVRYARAAVAAQDRLVPDDPPVWLIPARHALGAALLTAGRAAEAAAVYRTDLQRHPNNAVALSGLAAAERRLHNSPASSSFSE